MADDVLAPDELISDGVMVRHLKEGDYFYSVPKANLPTEPSDDLKADPYATNFKPLSEAPGLPVRRNNPMARPDEPGAPNYLMSPDLLEAQQGQTLPTGIAVNDAGIPFNKETGAEIPTVSRPNVLPIAKTPDGYTLAMPKMLDLAGNIMGGVAGVPAKAGEVVLGSGAVRKMADAPAVAAPFFSSLERAVDDAKIGKASADQWLGYLKNQPGVKSEELSTVLGDLKGTLNKSEIQDIIKNNKVELGEVVKGGDNVYGQKAVDAQNMYRQKLFEKYGNGIRNKATPDELKILDDLDERATKNNPNPTKYHSYQLPGSENYKEMLLTLPDKSNKSNLAKAYALSKQINSGSFDNNLVAMKAAIAEYNKLSEKPLSFKSSHWDEPNIVAHIRMNDRTVEGKKVLHLEELQSDWGQLIRKNGYKLDPKEKEILEAGAKSVDEKLIAAKRDDIMGNPDLKTGLDQAIKDKIITQKEADDYLKLTQNEHSTTPNMPFKKNWDELALKRMLHKAANEGYEGISWTPGEAQAARYDLSKQVDKIYAKRNNDGSYDLSGLMADGSGGHEFGKSISENKISDYVGKDLAEKIVKQKAGEIDYSGGDLKVGGEGMKTFYDKMLVDRANNLIKKYGSKVEQKEVGKSENTNYRIDKNIASSEEANKKYPYAVYFNNPQGEKRFLSAYATKKEAEEVLVKLEADKQPIHYLPITPELRARAKQGFPLFSISPTLTAVSHDPFNSDNQSKFKLTPVEYDPFK